MSTEVECPVCFCNFPTSRINNHVEACLTRTDKCSTRKEEQDLSRKHMPEHGTEEKGHISKACSHEKRQGKVSNNHAKIVAKKEFSNVSSEQLVTNVFGKRKYPEQASPDGVRVKLRTQSKLDLHSKLSVPPEAGKVELLSDKKSNAESTDEKSNGKQYLSEALCSAAVSNKDRRNTNHMDIVNKPIPLAEQMRPKDFDGYFGQDEVVGEDSSFRALLNSGRVPSMIFWGPPGCGKTSLVNIIGALCQKDPSKRFVKLSATTSGINDVKEAVKVARNESVMFKRRTVLFIDEIHRFNKLQQDFFLPHVEQGTITLIGATTENPSFQVNNALLSRCKVLVLTKHSLQSLMKILESAVYKMRGNIIANSSEKTFHTGPCFIRGAIETLANLSDGDARVALNGLEMAINCFPNSSADRAIDEKQIASVFQKNPLLYDRNGEEHYNIISAFHKCIRGSDDTATLYWLARMLESGEDPLYIARRMIRAASEDIGMADSSALPKAVAAYQACHFIGMPECEINLAHMAVYLARAPKSVEVYKAYKSAKSTIANWKGPQPGVPIHLRNAPTKLMKELGYGKDYKYNPDFDKPIEQDYLPSVLKNIDFFPT